MGQLPNIGESQVLQTLKDFDVKMYTTQPDKVPVWLVKREQHVINKVEIKPGAYCFTFEVPTEVSLVCLISEPSEELWDEMEDEGHMDDRRFDRKSEWLVVHCKHGVEATVFDAFWMMNKNIRGITVDLSIISFDGLSPAEVAVATEVNALIMSLPAIDYAPAYEVFP